MRKLKKKCEEEKQAFSGQSNEQKIYRRCQTDRPLGQICAVILQNEPEAVIIMERLQIDSNLPKLSDSKKETSFLY